MYFRFPRYSLRHASKWSILQAHTIPSRVLVATQRRIPTYRRQRHCPFLARRTALPKTTTELPPELTCKVEHRMISECLFNAHCKFSSEDSRSPNTIVLLKSRVSRVHAFNPRIL